jgi:hypothetical protein
MQYHAPSSENSPPRQAYLLAKTAIDALRHVDIVASGAARAILTRLCLNCDGLRWADGLAQLARNAPLLPCTDEEQFKSKDNTFLPPERREEADFRVTNQVKY